MATFRLSNGPVSLEIEDADCEDVDSILSRYGAQFNIPSNATAQVNGTDAEGSTPVSNGDEVAFNKPTGSKG